MTVQQHKINSNDTPLEGVSEGLKGGHKQHGKRKLTPEQAEKVLEWRFIEKINRQDIVAKVREEFGVDISVANVSYLTHGPGYPEVVSRFQEKHKIYF